MGTCESQVYCDVEVHAERESETGIEHAGKRSSLSCQRHLHFSSQLSYAALKTRLRMNPWLSLAMNNPER